jgi:hypothetical protein
MTRCGGLSTAAAAATATATATSASAWGAYIGTAYYTDGIPLKLGNFTD